MAGNGNGNGGRQGLYVYGELLDLGFGTTKKGRGFVILRVLERGAGATLRPIYHYGGVAEEWRDKIGTNVEVPVWLDCYVYNGTARVKFLYSTKRTQDATAADGGAPAPGDGKQW